MYSTIDVEISIEFQINRKCMHKENQVIVIIIIIIIILLLFHYFLLFFYCFSYN